MAKEKSLIRLKVDATNNGMSWDRFLETKPPYSIALDGYVAEPPRISLDGPYANFDHHHGVSRLETRATCAQVRLAVQQGLFHLFDGYYGGPNAHVWVNDCDQDVCFAWAILKKPSFLENPRFLQLLEIVDLRDTTGGFCPLPRDLQLAETLAWIFEDYQIARRSGVLAKRENDLFEALIKRAFWRIVKHIEGGSETVPVELGYRIIEHRRSGWSLVNEDSTDARMQMFKDGIRAFIVVSERPDGLWHYSIGRASTYINFPIPWILDHLRRAERDPKHAWGGSEVIAGSHRVHGSSLAPEKLADLVDDACEEFFQMKKKR